MNIKFPFWQELRKLLVDRGDGTYAERVEAYPPAKLMTDSDGANARLRVDVANTAFFASREFRIAWEFSIASGSNATIKFVVPLNIILLEQRLNVDEGRIRLTEATGGTEGGTFSTAITITRKNQMTSAPQPFYDPQCTVFTGGSHSGGLINDIVRCSAISQGQSYNSVGDSVYGDRGWATGNRYFDFQNIGNSNATGVFSMAWEERP